MKNFQNKIQFILVSGIISLFLINSTFAGSVLLDKDYKAAQQKLLRAYYILYTNYADELDPDEMTKAAIEGMTKELDPYTLHLEAQQKFRMDVLTRGQYGGVGIRIGSRNDTLTVISPMEDSPAWRAGFLPGDKIIKIDSLNTSDYSMDETAKMIRGVPGTTVELLVFRGNNNDEISFTLTREVIKVQEIPYAGFVEPGIAYVKLNGFSKNASKQLKANVDSLQALGMDALIIDLRNNTGGLLDQALRVLNLYLPKNEKVVETRGLSSRSNRNFLLTGKPIIDPKTKIAILVNQGSASASEIVAGATQDLDRGIIVGKTSFGKGLVQNIFPLDDSSAVKVTTSKYYIPSGRLIQKEDYFHDSDLIEANSEIEENYFTRSGRKVKQHGGIVPDSTVKSPDLHPIVAAIWHQGLYASFARDYLLTHPEATGHENLDLYYTLFQTFLEKKEFSYASPEIKQIEKFESKLISNSKNSDNTEQIKSIIQSLKDIYSTKQTKLLNENKNDIKLFLRSELVGFHGGQKARVENSLKDDKTLQTAISLLKNDDYLKKLGVNPFNHE